MFPSSDGRGRAASASGTARNRARRRRTAPGRPLPRRCPAPPSIPESARARASRQGLSLPPGNSHSPAIFLPSGRRASSTRLSTSISAQAATSSSGLPKAGSCVATGVSTLPNRSSRVASNRMTGWSPPRARKLSLSRRRPPAAQPGAAPRRRPGYRRRRSPPTVQWVGWPSAQRATRLTASVATPWPQ